MSLVAHSTPRVLRAFALSVLLGVLALGSTVMANQHASPSAVQENPRAAVTSDRLIEETLDWGNLPVIVDTLALTRVTLAPGATASVAGAGHLFFVESGSLALQEFARAYGDPTSTPDVIHTEVPAGPATIFGPGDRFAIAARGAAPPMITTGEDEPAVALVVSVTETFSLNRTINDAFAGWDAVELLAVVDAARVGPALSRAGILGGEPIVVSLDRLTYERGATNDFVWSDPAGRVFVVETGALNILAIDEALYWSARGEIQRLGATTRVSPTPGSVLLVPAPGRIGIRNVGREPATSVLVVTVGAVQE